jgi:Tfp pilus assembly protein PilV
MGLAAAMLIAGCGGGGSGGESGGAQSTGSSQEYLVFQGNSNGAVILDGAANRFSVRTADQKLVYLATKTTLNGLLVSNAGAVTLNGQKIAEVIVNQGSAVLACSGPAPNYGAMTITISGSTWKYSCASNAGVETPGSADDPNTGSNSDPAASEPFTYSSAVNECLDIRTHPTIARSEQMVNKCGFRINISYCTQGGDGISNNECAQHMTRATSLAANGTDLHNFATTGATTNYIVCKDPAYVAPQYIQWNGTRMSARCQTNN